MKQNNLEIITTQKEPNSKYGTQHGEHGLVTLESLPKHLPPETVADMTASWRDLLDTPIATKEYRDFLENACERLKQPVTVAWLMGRIATLQAQYYTSTIPEEMQEAIADDWHYELKEFPAWAISNAVRWWMGRNNDKRRYKPMCGDIAARCKTEMAIVKVAEYAIKRFDKQSNTG